MMQVAQRKFLSPIILAGYLAASGVAALFGGFFTSKVTITSFYAALAKPVWAPPGWLFGPVWFLLYISMSLAIWLVWKNTPVPPSRTYTIAHVCWWGQLILNAAWPVVFWLQPAGVAAFIACAVLALSIVICIIKFQRISLAAALLMLPYAAWVSFATALSWALWRMNSPL